MKRLYFTLLMLVTSAVSVAAPPIEEKKPTARRLTQVDEFPEKYRDAVRAIGAALSADGGNPSAYFAKISAANDGIWTFYLMHQSHPADDSGWRGDACGQCRMAFYDSKSGKFLRFQGIR